MLGFKSFESASRTLTGIEMVSMIKKEQVNFPLATSYKTFSSPSSLAKLNETITVKGLRIESIYAISGNIVDRWKKEFEMAKALKVKYITSESALNMLGTVDSSAGIYGIKKLKDHLIALHLKDIAAYNNSKLTDVPVGTGVINLLEVFQELKRQIFNGYIIIERDSQEKPSNLPSLVQMIAFYNSEVSKL